MAEDASRLDVSTPVDDVVVAVAHDDHNVACVSEDAVQGEQMPPPIPMHVGWLEHSDQ